MDTLLIYMMKVAVYLTAFYIVYSLLLSRDTAYGRNRAYLIVSLFSAAVLPLISFQTGKPFNIQMFGKLLSEVFVTASRENGPEPASGLSAVELLKVIYAVYIIGVVIILFKLIIDFLNLLFLIFRKRNSGSRIIRFHGFNTSGFSAMGYIFINTRLTPEESGEIIRHEQNHLHKNHFLDIILIEIVIAFQWFNPIVYLMNRALRAIHEFQADQGCLRSGVPVVNYQSLLLNQVFKSRAFNLTNSFSNPSLIKRRMIMMTKERTSSLASVKMLLAIPVTVLVFIAISAYKENPSEVQQESPVLGSIDRPVEDLSQNPDISSAKLTSNTPESAPKNKVIKSSSALQTNENQVAPPPPPPPPPSDYKTMNEQVEEEVPFTVVESMPMFPGGDMALLKFLAENTVYPETAKLNNIQGRVIIRFCVTAKGGVSQISVLKGVSPELDAEAVRVVETLPAFQPGTQGGKPVPVWYMVPITFTLK